MQDRLRDFNLIALVVLSAFIIGMFFGGLGEIQFSPCDESNQSEVGICGNGIIEGGEFCDGDNVSCAGGIRICDSECSSYSSCIIEEFCGDGKIGNDEECDGDEFAGESCVTKGYEFGDLECNECVIEVKGCGFFDNNTIVNETVIVLNETNVSNTNDSVVVINDTNLTIKNESATNITSYNNESKKVSNATNSSNNYYSFDKSNGVKKSNDGGVEYDEDEDYYNEYEEGYNEEEFFEDIYNEDEELQFAPNRYEKAYTWVIVGFAMSIILVSIILIYFLKGGSLLFVKELVNSHKKKIVIISIIISLFGVGFIVGNQQGILFSPCEAKISPEESVCGNGIIESGEFCDGNSVSCNGGVRSCVSDCSSFGVCEIDMECMVVDDPVCGADGKTYSNSCFAGLNNINVSCKGMCPCEIESVCGNGVIEDSETCQSRGFDTGNLVCSNGCVFDVRNCSNINVPKEVQSVCGNGVIEDSEICDGDIIKCSGGEQDCKSDCSGYETCAIKEYCGDGIVGIDEDCDGNDLEGETCQSRGFDTGNLVCSNGCVFDVRNCSNINEPILEPAPEIVSICGNGAIEVGEVCDSDTIGCLGGKKTCSDDCKEYETCVIKEYCGDGIVGIDEDCDGNDLEGETCQSRGFDNGELKCGGNCLFDTSGCGFYLPPPPPDPVEDQTIFISEDGFLTFNIETRYLTWPAITDPTYRYKRVVVHDFSGTEIYRRFRSTGDRFRIPEEVIPNIKSMELLIKYEKKSDEFHYLTI